MRRRRFEKASPVGDAREITVSARLHVGGKVLVEIADRGHGIAVGELERIFESYSSIPAASARAAAALPRRATRMHADY
jgi:signal transduction histidine kinase